MAKPTALLDVRYEVQRYLVSGQAKKVAKHQENIIGYVFAVASEERATRLEQAYIEAETVLFSAPGSTAYKTKINELFDLIVGTLFEKRDVHTILLVWRATLLSPTTIETLKDRRAAIQAAGRAHFLQSCLRCAGSSLERSLHFGLLLQEHWLRAVNGKVIAMTEALDEMEGRFKKDPTVIVTYEFLSEIVNIDAKVFGFMKQWFNNIVAAASTTPAASEILESLLEIVATHARGHAIDVLARTPGTDWIKYSKELQAIMARSPRMDQTIRFGYNPQVQLASPYDQQFRDWIVREQRELAERRTKGFQMLQWCDTHFNALRDRIVMMKAAIREHPRHGLRPGGFDHIEIRLTPLHNIGIRAVSFHPEGHAFPNTGMRILLRKETPLLLSFATTLDDFKMPLHGEIFRNKVHPSEAECQRLMHMLGYVLIDAMYRIVTGERKLKPARRAQGQDTDGTPTVPVRASLRHLHEGWQASAEARANAEEYMGWQLPSGFTFVVPFVRNGILAYHMPTEPTAVYGDDDLLDFAVRA